MRSPRVFTIPASAPFLSTLIGALRDGRLIDGLSDDPLALADATLFLPTRRACALAREEFLEALQTDAAVLPRLVPLGDIDEDELAFADMANGAEALESPDALGGLERRMLLAQLVLKWIASPSLRTGGGRPLVANSPASALALADALARLMDDMTTRQVAVEPAGRHRAARIRRVLEEVARVPADRPRGVARNPGRARTGSIRRRGAIC